MYFADSAMLTVCMAVGLLHAEETGRSFCGMSAQAAPLESSEAMMAL